MATSPIFAGTPKFANLVVNNANGGDPAYTNPTTIATLLTVGSTGGRIDTVYFAPVGTNAATSIRLFVDNSGSGSGGTANRLIYDQTVAATTSTTVAGLIPVTWAAGLVLPPSAVLRATVANTAVTNGICVSVEYGEF
jgi:hypothetical protein